MPTSIDIYSIKINSIASNGLFKIGDAFNNSPTANTKSQGQNSSYGDASPNSSGLESVFIEPDLNDMGEVANPTQHIFCSVLRRGESEDAFFNKHL
ncbi:spore germination protein [Halobacillus halophilus]|uniref:spore germination protein n=1 Tax=Halobacillus halophilus TaxID=1570 RepID=UPI001CD6FBB4|nr:spore germination protein [Halobacillus halophilus]MCA1012039.1 spore germination protein [Halobacillus halophilus]